MAFHGQGELNNILTITGQGAKFTPDISPRDITASGSVSVAAGELLPLTVQEADGSPLNSETHVLIFPNASVVSSGNEVQVIFPTADSGLIFNPGASSTDNALVRWDGTSGAVIQDSNAILDDDGNLILASGLTVGDDVNVTGDVTASRLLLSQVTISGSWYALGDSEYFALAASGASQIVLPASPVVGQVHVVKDVDGTAGSSTVTVLGSGVNIDGDPSIDLINDYQSIAFMFNGTGWSVF